MRHINPDSARRVQEYLKQASQDIIENSYIAPPPPGWNGHNSGLMALAQHMADVPEIREPAADTDLPYVCDSCLNQACDAGLPDRDSQTHLMLELGRELEDHLCDDREELDLLCYCSCNYRNIKKRGQPAT